MDTQTFRPFSVPPLSQRHFTSIGFVVLIHVALIYALMQMGVVDAIFVPSKEPITVSLPRTNEPPPPPAPVNPTTQNFERPTVVQPDITYADDVGTGAGNSITVAVGPSSAVVAAQSIARTITRPPYPPVSRRLGETGTVSLRLMISVDGMVTDAVVTRSSGFPRLDEAAVRHVIAHWRYKPALRDGRPVTSQTSANVKFELVN
jgi:protein TonB